MYKHQDLERYNVKVAVYTHIIKSELSMLYKYRILLLK